MTLLDALRAHLIAAGAVRDPGTDLAPAPRPWLPPVWRHPEGGAIAPGDAADQGKPAPAQDDGLVVSLMWAPGMAMAAGEEDRRRDGVDVWLRGNRVQAITDLETEIRHALLGNPAQPGGQTDFMLGGAGGIYCIQCVQWRPFQPLGAEPGTSAGAVFDFSVGYLFETRA